MTKQSAPSDVVQAALLAGFIVSAWMWVDDSTVYGRGVLDGNGEIFEGTLGEIRAFLRAWNRSRTAMCEEMSEHDGPGCVIVGISTGANDVQPGTTAQITVRPQLPTQYLFQGRRLAIPAKIAGSFDVVDVKVGHKSIMSSGGPIHGTFFAVGSDHPEISRIDRAENSNRMSTLAWRTFGRALPFFPCCEQDDIEISVANVSEHAAVFRGAIAGTLVLSSQSIDTLTKKMSAISRLS